MTIVFGPMTSLQVNQYCKGTLPISYIYITRLIVGEIDRSNGRSFGGDTVVY